MKSKPNRRTVTVVFAPVRRASMTVAPLNKCHKDNAAIVIAG